MVAKQKRNEKEDMVKISFVHTKSFMWKQYTVIGWRHDHRISNEFDLNWRRAKRCEAKTQRWGKNKRIRKKMMKKKVNLFTLHCIAWYEPVACLPDGLLPACLPDVLSTWKQWEMRSNIDEPNNLLIKVYS